MVYVLDKDGHPLMPTERHGKVRRLLNEGKAKVKYRDPFTIQLLYDTQGIVGPVTLGIDPGRTNIGACAVAESGKTLYAARVTTRNKEVPKLMKARKSHRQGHRKHGRREVRQRRARAVGTTVEGGNIGRRLPGYRDGKAVICKVIRNKEARYCNRRRKDGWLTPTARQLLQTHENLVRKIAKILPVSRVILELNKFAFMRLDDPSVMGKGFQNGPLKGFQGSVERAVYELQEGRCLLCGEPITCYHHVEPRRRNGSETVKNRVGLCAGCHRNVHTDPKTAERLQKKNEGLLKQYAATGVLNQVIPFLIADLSKEYDLSLATGYETYRFRKQFGLRKDHPIDAYAVACSILDVKEANIPEEWHEIRQFRRHDRQACGREMVNREYLLDGKVVAVNRHKAFEQKKDSLEEYVTKGGRTDHLTVRHQTKAMKDPCRAMPGSKIENKGRVNVMLGRRSHYYCFDDGSRLYETKGNLVLQNEGLVYVSNTVV